MSFYIQHLLNKMNERISKMQKRKTNSKLRGPGRPAGKTRPDGAMLLLRAGQSSFARYGFEGVSLRKIAAAAGVDPALASHHFGSKEALWQAVIDRMAVYFAPFNSELIELQRQVEVPIRSRLETALRQLISSVFVEPESGMLLARIGSETGEKLDLLIEKLIRPHHDAFLPLLREAMRAKVIAKQPPEVLYFMLLHAVTMSIAFRHILGYFDTPFEDTEMLRREMTQSLVGTFLGKPQDESQEEQARSRGARQRITTH
jgi:AcrR family transcriptional regulator